MVLIEEFFIFFLLWRAPRTTMVDPKVSPKISIL